MKPDGAMADGSDAVRAVYRAASDRLDEGPEARVRATVLAAAARAVDARPTDAAQTSRANPFRMRRWPLSAAALLVVSLMTGLIAERAMRDSPDRVTRIASSDARVAAAPPSVPDVPAPMAVPDAGAIASAGRTASADAPPEKRPSPKVRAKARGEPSPSQDAVQPPAPAASRSSVPAPVAAGAFSPSPPKEAAPSADRNEAAVAKPERRAPEAEAAAPGLSTRTMALRDRIGIEPPTPEAWVGRILKLRAAGLDAEADREVDALRARYPGFEIPAAALAATGTR